MLRFEGERIVPLAPAAAWAKLRDARFLSACIPDAFAEGEPTLDRAQVKIHPGFSFVRGTLDVTLTVVDFQEPTAVTVSLASKGIGTSSDIACRLHLDQVEGGARVRWEAEVVKLGGLLKAVPSGLIRGAAQKTIDDVWTEIVRRIVE